ncbi:pyridoxamine 5'-phosphate oxidase family protein [uncultured Maribacter sp.]|uniref:pyridoxamine 5'-phosphate oxidase family protein n=1 Tax=uncultured Maribacter sp. TaxID=431308 RepID=UPI002613CF07|nr:pyridoxamine 5'-phosphate oxidase family protein [uncultured Maribacter sp.]
MTNLYLQEIKSELKLALTKKNHPLKFCVLGTIGSENTPQLRIIGLRKFTDDFSFTLYTDRRSAKVSQITKNYNVSLLFYHPVKKLQIKIEGIANVVKDCGLLKEQWLKINEKAKRDYTTMFAPGSKINSPEEITYLKEKNFFSSIEIKAETIEYLKLKETSHFKVQFHKDINGWVSEFLVP